MNITKEFRWFKLGCVGLIAALLCVSGLATAQGPFDAFPDFIPFTGDLAVDKIGDVAFDKTGNVYVNVTAGGRVEIWEFSPDGEELFSTYICEGSGYGLALDANGDIYAAVAGTERGIYRLDRHGNVVLLPGTGQIVLANALAFDQQGNLYVTESFSVTPEGYGQGGIWRIPKGGAAELMLRDDLLTGNGSGNLGYPMGANGVAFYHGDLYVANCEESLILRIPIENNGDLGQPDIWRELDEVDGALPFLYQLFPIAAPDGIALDVFGNVYIAVVSRSAVVRINAEDLSQETVAIFPSDPENPLYTLLNTPNSIAFGTGKGLRKNLLVTNLGLFPVPQPGCGLVKIEAEAPGLPLP
ncbi:MAG: SMP-30/gluconolactonase/LRE family protein [Deltaproteobacteria bacterium]|nr:SMP-30/gluconolactonase/LRE family protein [Deltaproteobacteria bacterium]